MNGNTLFPNFMNAVNALRECCGENAEIPPIARSEVYNETWLLRLTLALIHDSGLKENAPNALQLVKKAVMHNWISEGGLEPAFEREGTTWTDAILGDVKIGANNKRGIVLAPISDGVVIVEAKMDSELAPGITNSAKYNQAARNIACLAKLVASKGEDYSEKCAFVLVAPKQRIENKCGTDVQTLIKGAMSVIEGESRRRKWGESEDQFQKTVQRITSNSEAIAWEDVIKSIQSKTKYLQEFYVKTCGVFNIASGFQDG